MAWSGMAWPGGQADRPIIGAFALMLAAAMAAGVAQAQDAAVFHPVVQAGIGAVAVPMFADPALDDHSRALDCMSMAIAYEAAGQPVAGQQAVGQVILNRLRAARFPKTVCGVVFQGSERITGCQFTFTCDGSFRRRMTDTTLFTARSVAETVLNGAAPDRVAGATNYHASYVLPYWASSGTAVARIGAHIFYRMPGDTMRAGDAAGLTEAEPEMALPKRWSGHRHWSKPGPALAQATGAVHAIFAPWGLPVGSAAQR